MRELEAELERTRQQLQSTIEQYETSQEENRHRVEELDQRASDLQNRIRATEIATLFLDRELRVQYVTPPVEELLDVRPADGGRPISDFTRRLDYGELREDAERVMRRREPVEREVQDEAGRWYLTRVLPSHSVEDHIEGVALTFVEISERKRVEKTLRQSEERFRAFVNASSSVVYRMSPDWTEMRELDGQGIIADTKRPSQTWLDEYIHVEDQPQVLEAIEEAIRTKSMFRLEHRVRHLDGTLGWTLSRAIPLLDDEGEIVEWFGTASDITERKEAEEALRQSETRYRTLFESIDEGFCVVEVLFDERSKPVDYRFLEANPAFEEQTDLKDAVGWRMRALRPHHEQHWFDIYGRVAKTGKPERFTHEAKHLDGRIYDVYAFRIGAAEERKVAILFNDVTKRKRAEQELREINKTLEKRVEERTQQVRTLASQLTMVEQEERRRLSQVLHDDLQQLLYGIEMKIRKVQRQAEQDEAAVSSEDLAEVQSWIDRAFTTTRQLTVDLSPPVLKGEGLADALEWLQRQMKELYDLEVTVKAEHGFYLEDDDLRVLLFQVVRELLFNVEKHADVDRATVRLAEAKEDGHFVVHVIDEGRGFDVETVLDGEKQQVGFALFNARERLSLLGGRLEVHSVPGEGTHVEVHAPPSADAESLSEEGEEEAPA